jgi:hypothetical protein
MTAIGLNLDWRGDRFTALEECASYPPFRPLHSHIGEGGPEKRMGKGTLICGVLKPKPYQGA